MGRYCQHIIQLRFSASGTSVRYWQLTSSKPGANLSILKFVAPDGSCILIPPWRKSAQLLSNDGTVPPSSLLILRHLVARSLALDLDSPEILRLLSRL